MVEGTRRRLRKGEREEYNEGKASGERENIRKILGRGAEGRDERNGKEK